MCGVVCVCERETERDRERQRETERETETERDTFALIHSLGVVELVMLFGLLQGSHWCIPPRLVGPPTVTYVGSRYTVQLWQCNNFRKYVVPTRRVPGMVPVGPTLNSTGSILTGVFTPTGRTCMYSLVRTLHSLWYCTVPSVTGTPTNYPYIL